MKRMDCLKRGICFLMIKCQFEFSKFKSYNLIYYKRNPETLP